MMRNSIVNNVLTGILAIVTLAAYPAFCQTITITTFAGNGIPSFSGDGGQATAAALNHPKGIAFDSDGSVYVADTDNRRIRRIRPDGMIFTVAGSGVPGSSGDGGMAVNASFNDIPALAVDANRNIYIADASNRRIRKVAPDGTVSTVAGTGIEGFSGDGGLAMDAQIGRPVSVLVDVVGNLYFSDSSNQRIRRIGVDGRIATIAGNGVPGYSGDGGPATAAMLQTPLGLAMDNAGNLYVADGDNNRIRRISPTGTIITVAGTGAGGFSGDGAAATTASINIPSDVTVDSAGNLYIADSGNNRVRRVSASGVITTVAGTGIDGFSGDGGLATQAQLNFPWGLATDSTGRIYIADRVNNRVRVLSGGPGAVTQNPPSISSNGIVNGASFLSNGVSPGGIAAIFGEELAVGQAVAVNVPLATVLGETSVTFNGAAAPLLFVSSRQINVQVPFEVTPGLALVQVRRGNTLSAVRTVSVNSVSPGIFIVNQAANTGAILHASSYALVDAGAPARPGEFLLIYSTGLGHVRTSVATGNRAPTNPPFAETVVTPTVTIGGVPANVAFSGLAPGFVGLYQLNVTVPFGLQQGTHGVQIAVNGSRSNTATLVVTQ